MAFACVAALFAAAISSVAGEQIMARYKSDLFPGPSRMHRAKNRWADCTTPGYTPPCRPSRRRGDCWDWRWAWPADSPGVGVGYAHQAAILGCVLGTATAGGIARVLVPIVFKRFDPNSSSLVVPLPTHGAIWAGIGADSGLVFAVGLGGRSRWITTLVGGLLGAAPAAIVYENVGALAFSSDHTDLPLSASITTRGMAQFLVAIFSAIGAVLALHQSLKEANLSVSV